jgi:TRAP-type C4-dicarboxylate transport system permease large subunit
VSIELTIRPYTVPFIVLMLGLLLLITYVPIFSTWLPHLLMH